MHIVQFSLICLYYVKKGCAVLKGLLDFEIQERMIYFSDAKSTRSKSLDNLLPAGTEENFFGLSESKLNQRYLSQVKLSFFSLSLSVCLYLSLFLPSLPCPEHILSISFFRKLYLI